MRDKNLDLIETIDTHLDNFFEEEEIIVYHETETPKNENHIDIYWIKPQSEIIDYSILMTVGMSRVEQNFDNEIGAPKYIEVAMLIPKEWDFKDYKWSDNEFWPIHHLRTIAKIPTKQDTWLGFGHTISWKYDNSEIPGTGFNSSIILTSLSLPDKFINVKIKGQKKIYVYSTLPLYPEELNFKLNHTTDGLLDKFDKFGIQEVVDVNRINTCKKRDKL